MINITRLAALTAGLAFTAASWAGVPFKVTQLTADGKFAPTTTWYNMGIGTGNLCISDNDGADYITLTGHPTTADKDLWCFVGDDANGYLIYNKQAGTALALAAPTTMSDNAGGTSYAVLRSSNPLAAGYTNRWDFKEATKTSSNKDIDVKNGYFVSEHGLADNILNNREAKLAFWSKGYDNGSAITITQAVSTFGVSLSSGTFTASNDKGTFASAWASTATEPQLRLTTGANNMSKPASAEGINLASGQSKSSVYTLTAGKGYVVKSYTFTFRNEKSNTNEVKFTIGDKTYTIGNEAQTLSINDLDEAAAQFTLSGDNHNVLLTDFTVEVAAAPAEGEAQTDLFITDGSKPYPYRIPAIAKAHNGDLIALSDYRICGADIGYGRVDLVGRISSDNGRTWGKEFIVKSGTGVSGAVDCGFGDPAIVADSESDEVLLISVCGHTPYGSATRSNPNRVARFRSHDNGRTWSDYEEITDSIYPLFDKSSLGVVNSLFFGSGRICQSRQVKVGKYYRLYAALCARPNGNRVIYSDDFGQSWHALGSINSSPAPNGDEPKCEELPDGTVILSSRMNGGRYYNFFTYTDVASAQGSWGNVATSNADNKGTSAVSNSTNGEILILPAVRKADNAEVYVALQSVPFGSGRANVGIYYKVLATPADAKTPAVFASNWNGKHQASHIGSAYSTMIMQENDSIAFFYEEETYGKAYTNVYKQYSLEGLTNGAYSYRRTQSPASFVKQQLDLYAETATKNLEYGVAVGQVKESERGSMEQAIEQAINAYVSAPTPQGYIDAQKRIDQAVSDARVQIVDGGTYTLVNKLRANKYLTTSDELFDGKATFGGTEADYESTRQIFVFESAGEAGWRILNKASQTYLSATKANAKQFVTQETDKALAGTFRVEPYKQGWSNVVCTNPTSNSYASLNLNASFRLIQSSKSTDAARWMVVPANLFTGIAEAETEQKDLQLYDLQGRRIKQAPRMGVYITSDHVKHVAH